MTGSFSLNNLRTEGEKRLFPNRPRISVGMGTCGQAAGAEDVVRVVRRLVLQEESRIDVVEVGCAGACWAEPLMGVSVPGNPIVMYGGVDAGFAEAIVDGLLKGELPPQKIVGKVDKHQLLHIGKEDVNSFNREEGFFSDAFFSVQCRRVMARCGFVDPTDISEYVATGGYQALADILCAKMPPDQVVELVERSGLQGRGGAGFPTGKKWRQTLLQDSDEKYVIANADEGDPGAFMDRCLMESDPFAILEGLCIAGYATGAHKGYIFTRSEYPHAIDILQKAIESARSIYLLGCRVLGSDWSFDIELVRSAGAYVCGEGTALVRAMEGRPGRPRKRPPRLVEQGLWGKPTCMNNVETLANVPLIVAKGCEWFRSVGTEANPGTKIFSVAGAVLKPGLVEVPLGTHISNIQHAVCSAFLKEGSFTTGENAYGSVSSLEIKAVQIGGPSGVLVPPSEDVCLDYEGVEGIGSGGGVMGSGGLVFLGLDHCIVDTARYFMEFSVHEDCGQCRSSNRMMRECLDILTRIAEGKGAEPDLETLHNLAEEIPRASLCGLGKMSVNPLASSLHYFEDEFRAHLRGLCPSMVCRDLIRFQVVDSLCPGCRCCAPVCPSNAMQGKFGKPYHIVDRLCIRCRMCVSSCPYHAVEVLGGDRTSTDGTP